MSQIVKIAPFAALTLLLLATVGCNQSGLDAKQVAAYRAKLALAEEPDDVQTVSDVRHALLGEEAGHEDHDHDGDGQPDHDAADHDAEADDHAGHDEDDDQHAGHDEAAHAEEDHDHDGDGQPDHDADAHDESGHAHATEPQDVAMVGHIGGLANPWGAVQPDYPFAKSQAVFFLADPQAVVENEADGHAHAPGEECAYCLAHAADREDMLAVVRFVDEKGDVLPMDVRQLFDVKEKDTVVVRGQARVTEGGILVVNAQGLYIRQ